MGDKIFSKFFRAAGYKVVSSASSDWYEIHPGMLLSIPYHRLIAPEKDELDDLIARTGVWGVRFPTYQNYYGFYSYLTVCHRIGYDIGQLPRKTRNRVQKGEQCCQIREMPFGELAELGLALNRKTCARQRRKDPKEDSECWRRLCQAGESTNEAVAIGAFYQEHLAAYIVILETPSMAELIIQSSDSELLEYCPNNILTYAVTRRYLTEREKPIPVCYGLGSLEETLSLDRYKLGMGYEMRQIKQCLYFKKEIRWLLNPVSLITGEWLQQHVFPKNYLLRKSCGILKNYLLQSL